MSTGQTWSAGHALAIGVVMGALLISGGCGLAVGLGRIADAVDSEECSDNKWSTSVAQFRDDTADAEPLFERIVLCLVNSDSTTRKGRVADIVGTESPAAPQLLVAAVKELDCNEASRIAEVVHNNFRGSKESSEARLAVARCYGRTGEVGHQLAELKVLLRENPRGRAASKAHQLLGIYHERIEQRAKAERHYRAVLKLEPHSSSIAESATRGLKRLSRYALSPLFDRLLYWIDTRFTAILFPASPRPLAAHALSISVVRLVVHLGIVFVLVAVVGLAEANSFTAPPREFEQSLPWLTVLVVGRVLFADLGVLLILVICQQNEDCGALGLGGRLRQVEAIWEMAVWASVSGIVLRHHRFVSVLTGTFRLRALVIVAAGVILGFVVLRIAVGPPVERPIVLDARQPMGLLLPQVFVRAAGEELLYRGAIHDTLERRLGAKSAALIGSILFALSHMAPIGWSIQLFAFGLIMVWLRRSTGSIGSSILCHGIVNGLLVLGRM